MNSKYMKRALYLLPALLLIALAGCRPKQTVSSTWSQYNFGVHYVGTDGDGTLTLRAWGNGPDIDQAVENAKKNALNQVLFKGVSGASGINADPLVTEVNARERYAEYFDRFFAPGGEYANFVRETSRTDGSRMSSESNSRRNYSIIVTVDRPALRQQLRADGVIK